MKGSRMIMAAIAVMVTLLMAMITPVAWIGLLIVAFSLYQTSQKRKGKRAFAGWLITVGILGIILGGCGAPSEEVE